LNTHPDQAATSAISQFNRDVEAAKQQHATLIAELEAELIGVSYEMSDSYSEFTDELAADLGARAANECEVASDQESAISRCESFVSNEIACDAMRLVSACIAFHGAEQGSAVINKMVSESPVRNDYGIGR